MKISGKTALRSLVVVIAVAMLGWQWWGKRHPRADEDASPVTDAPAVQRASAKAAPPATLKLGALTLRACELKRPQTTATTAAFCAMFPVPENRADPHSRKIDLKLAVIKSDSQVAEPDLVTYLAGGPGESAIQTRPVLASAFEPLKKHHDILLLDQRGTGDSHPLSCPSVEKTTKQFIDKPFNPERSKALTAQCLAEVVKTSDPRFYTTTDAVADLEAVREALGAPQLDLVGVSYGTRMAQQYARAWPKSVRSIVLDGVVPNQLVLTEDFANALEGSLKLQAAACDATPACKQAFGDWYATLHALHDKLTSQPPVPVTFNDPRTFKPVTRAVSADVLAGVVRFFSYSADTAALLPLAVNEASKGDYAPLMGQSQVLTGDLSGDMNGGMQLSVACSEDADLLPSQPAQSDAILGTELIDGIKAMCAVWPRGARPDNFHVPFRSSIPTLLLSGERDPVTPPAYAAEVLGGLSNGRSLVVKGLGHAEPINAGCMPKLVEQFVVDLKPQQLDAKCLDRIGPVPAFVNYNGASP